MRPKRPKFSHKRPALFWLIAPLLPFVAVAPAFAQQDTEPVIRFVRNPDPAPDFKFTSLDGKPLALEAARGKVVFLNFWATWCGPCRAEVPDLIDLQAHYKDRLQVIGLDVDDDDPAEVQKYVADTGINYPVAIASDEVRKEYGGIAALPTSFVLDTEGRIVQKHVGLFDPELYETEIRALLGLPIQAKVETFEDTGEIFLKHADRATELPGVDLSKLTPEQKKIALHRLNADSCTCGCKYTLAQCRIWDSACPISKAAAEKIIATVSGVTGAPGEEAQPGHQNAPPAPSSPQLPRPDSPPSVKTPAAPSSSQPK
ncbi:MAG: redoxin family protein [Candidatus Acidiferrum sp.]